MRTGWRIWWGSVILLVILGLVGFKFYQIIQNEVWAEEDIAVRIAAEQADLVKTDKVESFVGDRPYSIVFGEDRQGRKLVVWLSENDIHSEFADQGISAETAVQKVKDRVRDAKVLRTTPGKLQSSYVWQVFYERQEEGKKRLYYDYFGFKDGVLLDTWTLSLQ